MSRYAQGTSVPIERSKTELEHVLARYGAERFGYGTEPTGATVMFQVRGRAVRMRLLYPKADTFKKTPTGKTRVPEQQRLEWESALRSSWRAKFDDEWLAYFVTASGQTVGERLVPQLATALASSSPETPLLGMGERL